MNKVSAIIFDLDGVLIKGSNESYYDAYDKALKSVGLDIPRETQIEGYLAHWSKPHHVLLGLFIDDPDTLREACEVYEREVLSEQFFDKVQAVPGIKEALLSLHAAGIKMGIATGMHHDQVPFALKKIGVSEDIFGAVMSGYQVQDPAHQKPDRYMVDVILADLERPHGETLFVGDSKTDIQMGHNAGNRTVAVLTGNMNRQDAQAQNADHILETASELTGLLGLAPPHLSRPMENVPCA